MSDSTKLTPEQIAKVEEYQNRWLDKIFKYENVDLDEKVIIERTKEMYKFCGLTEPEVLVVDSPYQAQVQAARLTQQTYTPFSSYINCSDFGWLAFYEFFNKEIGLLKEHEEDLNKIVSFAEVSFMSIQLQDYCIVSRYPVSISRNENLDLHNTLKPAIQFKDGYGQHYVNGRFIEPELFEAAQQLDTAREAFLQEENEDIKACIVTIIKENEGNDGLLKMLNAEVVDRQTVVHEGGYSEEITLYRTRERFPFLQNSKGESDQPGAWLELVCPSTKTRYLIDVCPLFDNALDAAKWLRPEKVPGNVPYIWQSAN